MQSNTFDSDKFKEDLWEEFKSFCYYIERLKSKVENKLNVKLLDSCQYKIRIIEVFERYKKDKLRLQIFHPVDKISIERQIGLLVYWIVKIKPFYVDEEQTDETILKQKRDRIRYINELIACCCFSNLVNEKVTSFEPSAEMFKKFTYEFKYRNITQSSITNIIYALAKKWNK